MTPSPHIRAKHGPLLGYVTYSHVVGKSFCHACFTFRVAEDAFPAAACARPAPEDEVAFTIRLFPAAQANVRFVHGAGSGVRSTVAATNSREIASASGVSIDRPISGLSMPAV